MQLTILGSGTGLSDFHRATAGYLVEHKGKFILLDFGCGVYKNLQRVVSPERINRIFISHIHLDHVTDLGFFMFVRKHARNRTVPLYVYGPKGFKKFIKNLCSAYPSLQNLPYKVHVKELHKSKLKVNGFSIQTKPMNHNVPTIGFRITAQGKSLTYSGDTGWCDALLKLSDKTAVLLIESTLANWNEFHLLPEEIGKIAAIVESGKLIVTHSGPEAEKLQRKKVISKYYSGPIVFARDLMKIKI